MNANARIHFVEIPFGGSGGLIWNRLHSEREDICEALIKGSRIGFGTDLTREGAGVVTTENWHQESLQARLRQIDAALDRVMSHSYSSEVVSNPNISPVLNEVMLECLDSFDTILVRTLNSDYRILMLDPKTGRALVEGGQYFDEPREAWLIGSTLRDSPSKLGLIVVGYHLERWVDDNFVRTSRVQSLSVGHRAPAESIEAITEAIH